MLLFTLAIFVWLVIHFWFWPLQKSTKLISEQISSLNDGWKRKRALAHLHRRSSKCRIIQPYSQTWVDFEVLLIYERNTYAFPLWVEIVRSWRVQYWVIRSSAWSLLRIARIARTAHSFHCFALLSLLPRAPLRSFVRSRVHGKVAWVCEMNAPLSCSF